MKKLSIISVAMIILLIIACVGIPVYATNNEMTVQPRSTSYTLYHWVNNAWKTSNLSRNMGSVTLNATLSGDNYMDVAIFNAYNNQMIGQKVRMQPGERTIHVWSSSELGNVSTIYVLFTNYRNISQFVNGYISY